MSLTGCFTAEPERSISRFELQGPFSGPQGEDVVQLDIAILEFPVGDSYVNKDLWVLADEAVSPDQKWLLQKNGFRACLAGSTPPPGLLDRLKSEKYNFKPRRVGMRSNQSTPIQLGPAWETCKYTIDKTGLPIPVEVHQAQCVLNVIPTLTDDGGVKLRFAPEVRHGMSVLRPRPVQEAGGAKSWTLVPEQPTESYPWLDWDMTVQPNEYVAVGTLLDQTESLGFRFFLHTETNDPVQRLLVIRATRAPRVEKSDISFDQHAPPLALQVGGWRE
jgi:hypothetical protein